MISSLGVTVSVDVDSIISSAVTKEGGGGGDDCVQTGKVVLSNEDCKESGTWDRIARFSPHLGSTSLAHFRPTHASEHSYPTLDLISIRPPFQTLVTLQTASRVWRPPPPRALKCSCSVRFNILRHERHHTNSPFQYPTQPNPNPNLNLYLNPTQPNPSRHPIVLGAIGVGVLFFLMIGCYFVNARMGREARRAAVRPMSAGPGANAPVQEVDINGASYFAGKLLG